MAAGGARIGGVELAIGEPIEGHGEAAGGDHAEEDADEFLPVGVGNVPQAKGDRDDLKRVRRQRQRLGVGFEKRDSLVGARLRRLLPTDVEHLVAEVGGDDVELAAGRAIERQRQGRRCRCRRRGSAASPPAARAAPSATASSGRCRARADDSENRTARAIWPNIRRTRSGDLSTGAGTGECGQ